MDAGMVSESKTWLGKWSVLKTMSREHQAKRKGVKGWLGVWTGSTLGRGKDPHVREECAG